MGADDRRQGWFQRLPTIAKVLFVVLILAVAIFLKDVHHETMGRTKRPRRSFSKQFQAEVVDLVRQPGNSPTSVARDLDLTESAVRTRVRQAEIDDGGRDGLTSAERDERLHSSLGYILPIEWAQRY